MTTLGAVTFKTHTFISFSNFTKVVKTAASVCDLSIYVSAVLKDINTGNEL